MRSAAEQHSKEIPLAQHLGRSGILFPGFQQLLDLPCRVASHPESVSFVLDDQEVDLATHSVYEVAPPPP